MNPLFLIDFYKVGHRRQYQKGITRIWVNWTPRSSRRPERNGAIHFGLRYFINKILDEQFFNHFFSVPLNRIVAEYKEAISKTLNIPNPETDHIEALHRLGYLPLEIYSVPEGTFVPSGVPAMVIVNTHPDFFWLPNYIETILSNCIWLPSTSATTATVYREIFVKAAKDWGERDLSFVDWQGHDFSMRGMAGLDGAITSGMGHLLSFSGTDTLPAILGAMEHYDADLSIGGSVNATEHSVMCAGSKEAELSTFRRLLRDVYPTGIVSIVSDTWDLWRVLTEYIPALRSEILARDGKIVIRPDSGDPVKIMCGNPNATDGPERAGVLRLLADVMGTDDQGHIIKAGAIYGDSITPERARAICDQTTHKVKLSPFNFVLGIGSYTYNMVTRDTHGFAMKATAVEQNGVITPIFKDPVTDHGDKKSHIGIPVAYLARVGQGMPPGMLYCDQGQSHADLERGEFRKVYYDGTLLIDETFDEIRRRTRSQRFDYEREISQ